MTISLTEFQELLQRHGADLQQWPVVKVGDALKLLEESEEALSIFREAQKRDATSFPDAPDHLLSKIMKNIDKE